jgi:scyllo-inositol 2-dehydrogenase (NADP+)
MSKTVAVGLIGFGLSGRYFHAPFLTVHPHFNIKKVVTKSAQAVKDFDASIAVVDDYKKIIDDSDIELVFVCTPNHLHYPLAYEALTAGKHVVIEKPFANTQQEAESLMALADKKGLIATAYQNRRWDADFLTIQRLIAQNTLGDIIEYESYFDRFRPEVPVGTWKELPQAGAGNLYNLGPHLIDQALVLFGTPEYVSARIKTIRKNAITDDYFDLTLDYTDKRVRLHASLMAADNRLRYKIHGTAGSFIKNGLDIQEDTLKQHILPNTHNWGVEPRAQFGVLSDGLSLKIIQSEAGCYMSFYENLYEAIVHQKEILVKPQQAFNTTRVIELAIKSNAKNKKLSF